MATVFGSQTVHGDGRVDLPDHLAIAGSRFYNTDLAPVPVGKRTWSTYNYLALWMGMAHNIPSYLLASGLIAIGMSWSQAFLTITLGNLIVLAPMLLNSHAGTKYGIPFPVFARAFYGIRGANLAALLRAFVACGWFGIQTWVGGQAIYTIIGRLTGDGWTNAAVVMGQPATLWLCFAAFWVLQMVIIWRGMNAVKWLENWAAPLITLCLLALAVWVVGKAGGLGPILTRESKLGWGADFWAKFFPALMGMIAFWATLSLNMPDFTRFSRSQRGQATGQILGLPTTMSLIAILSIVITSGTEVIYGEAIWNPVELTNKFTSPVAVVVGLVIVVLATITTNLAANVVSPSYDFSNVFPRWISFRVGGLITGAIGIAIMPWRLLDNPYVYFGWLEFYGGVLAAVAGVLIAGYWVRDRTRLELEDLYGEQGRYWFWGGWNWQAVVATALGALLAVGGANSAPGEGPFPTDGLIPLFSDLYAFSWAVGLAVAFVVYLALMGPAGRNPYVPAAAGTPPGPAPAGEASEGEVRV